MSEPRAGNDLDFRLPAIRVRDVILAALQMSFAQDDLLGPGRQNVYRYVPGDPQRSLLWISSGENRIDGAERDGRRLLITVTRGDYTPQEMHLQNHAGGGFGGPTDWSDLGTCYIFINCEAGNETAAEALASMCYHIIKTFRPDIRKDFDVHSLRLLSISPATQVSAGKGQPFVCRVAVEVKIQEHSRQIEISNPWNHTVVRGLMANGTELFKNELTPTDPPETAAIVLPSSLTVPPAEGDAAPVAQEEPPGL